MIQILCVPPHMFSRVWPHCEELIRRGLCSAPDLVTDDLPERIAKAELLFWIVWDGSDEPLAAFFTELREEDDTGQRFVVVCGLAGRQLWKWARKLGQRITTYALAEGCACVRWYGKRGWSRLIEGGRIVAELMPGVMVYERRIA